MCAGATGFEAVAGIDLKNANVTRGIISIWFTGGFNSMFALAQIKSQSIQNKIKEKTNGIALKQINLADLRRIEFIVPPHSTAETIFNSC